MSVKNTMSVKTCISFDDNVNIVKSKNIFTFRHLYDICGYLCCFDYTLLFFMKTNVYFILTTSSLQH